MKKIIQEIKLRKFKTKLNESSLKPFENQEFLVWYNDNTCELIYFTDELRRVLEKDHIKPVRYIFDLMDRIIVDRTVKIDMKEVEKDE